MRKYLDPRPERTIPPSLPSHHIQVPVTTQRQTAYNHSNFVERDNSVLPIHRYIWPFLESHSKTLCIHNKIRSKLDLNFVSHFSDHSVISVTPWNSLEQILKYSSMGRCWNGSFVSFQTFVIEKELGLSLWTLKKFGIWDEI